MEARALLCRAVAGLLLTIVPGLALANHHLLSIREVYPGAPTRPQAQYIVLQMYASGQNVLTGRSVKVFDAAGAEVGSFAFTANPSIKTSQARVLLATPEAEAFFGISGDLPMTSVLPLGGGMVCFDTVDCVSWGNYSGSATSPSASGVPFNRKDGLLLGRAVRRNASAGSSATLLDSADDTDDSRTDFQFALAPLPGNNAGAIASPPKLLSLASSVGGSSTADKVVLLTEPNAVAVTAQLRDGLNGNLIGSLVFESSHLPLLLAELPDSNGNNAAEVVLLGVDRDSDAPRVEVRDAGSGVQLSLVSFSSELLPQGFAMLADMNANDHPELALLGIRGTDRTVIVEIRDSLTGSLLRTVGFNLNYVPRAFAVLPDISGNGKPELAVLGVGATDLRSRFEIRDSATSAKAQNDSFLLNDDSALAMIPIPDADMDGIGDHAVLVKLLSNGTYRVRTRSGASPGTLASIVFRSTFVPLSLGTVADLNANIRPELVVFGFNGTQVQAEVRDSVATGPALRIVRFNMGRVGMDSGILPDQNLNGSHELDLLSKRDSDQGLRVESRDSDSGSQIMGVNF